jgi:hypothetical protein
LSVEVRIALALTLTASLALLGCGSSESALGSPLPGGGGSGGSAGAGGSGGSSGADAETDSGADAFDASAPDAGDVAAPLACNGSAAYCDRPYNQVAQACTHNSMSNDEDPGFDIPTANQGFSFARQLDDGVRCMMLDTYMAAGAPALCHASCVLGSTPWVPMLQNVAGWLDAHPGEVLTFILESYITEAETKQALIDGGVYDRVYHHNAKPGSPWPTLRWLVEHDKRLVVFTDDSAANGDWHLDWRQYGWETQYDDPTFSCDEKRGDPTAYDNQVFILNHYALCPSGGCASNGETNNAYTLLFKSAVECWHKDPKNNPWTQIPTFVNVDHFEVPAPGESSPRADVFDAVDALNAAWPTPPF